MAGTNWYEFPGFHQFGIKGLQNYLWWPVYIFCVTYICVSKLESYIFSAYSPTCFPITLPFHQFLTPNQANNSLFQKILGRGMNHGNYTRSPAAETARTRRTPSHARTTHVSQPGNDCRAKSACQIPSVSTHSNHLQRMHTWAFTLAPSLRAPLD